MTERLVIFDLDGTVLDTLRDLFTAVNAALRQNGLPERTLAEVRGFVGNGIRKLIERSVPAGTPEETAEAVFRDFSAYYAAHCADATAPYGGVRETVALLRSRGYRTAVISNKADFAVQRLVSVYFPGDFDYCAGERAHVRRKPAPDMVNAALEALNVQRENAVFVGDSEVDVQTARAAGIPIVSVTWGFKDRDFLLENGAQTLIDTPQALPGILPELYARCTNKN